MGDDNEHLASIGGEVLPPEEERARSQEEQVFLNQNLLAISNYTDRPDLLIAELEKHDPGFVQRMNAASERDNERMRDARFSFGRFQAYTALMISVLGACVLLGAAFFAVFNGGGFGVIIALALFYAVTQGGSSGFLRLIDALSDMVRRGDRNKNDNRELEDDAQDKK